MVVIESESFSTTLAAQSRHVHNHIETSLYYQQFLEPSMGVTRFGIRCYKLVIEDVEQRALASGIPFVLKAIYLTVL